MVLMLGYLLEHVSFKGTLSMDM